MGKNYLRNRILKLISFNQKESWKFINKQNVIIKSKIHDTFCFFLSPSTRFRPQNHKIKNFQSQITVIWLLIKKTFFGINICGKISLKKWRKTNPNFLVLSARRHYPKRQVCKHIWNKNLYRIWRKKGMIYQKNV